MYHVKLLVKRDIAEGTAAFWFAKPTGYNFVAGQHTAWQLINPPETDAEGDSREFSFASAPHEDFLMIASRMRDTAFKRVLHNLPIGTEIEIEEPEGGFVLHSDSSRPAIFLAGGIGITPFRSIVVDAAFRKLSHKIFLFSSNRQPKDAPLLEELKNLANPNYEFIPVFTDQTGHLTMEQIKENTNNISNPVYYIAGPPAMVRGLRDTLISSGIDDLSIRSENFEGY